jgi:hypothetical protein
MNSLKPYHDLEIDAHVTSRRRHSPRPPKKWASSWPQYRDNNEPETAKESADHPDKYSLGEHVMLGIELWEKGIAKIPPDNGGKRREGNTRGWVTGNEKEAWNLEGLTERLPIILAEWHRHVAAVRW